MIKVSNKIYSFLSLLFVFLSLLGYQIVTSLFLPVSSDIENLSHTVTYPYRAVIFIIAVFLIVLTPEHKLPKRLGSDSTIYIVFMIIYFTRIILDIYVRDIFVQSGFKLTVLRYIYLSMIPSIWATARCALSINYEKLNKWMLVGGIVLLGVIILNQGNLIASSKYEDMTRRAGNVALDSLGLGYTCVSLFAIFYCWLKNHKSNNKVWSIILITCMFTSFVIMLRSGSRGPLVAFVTLLLFIMYSSMKNKVLAVSIIILALVAMWIFMSNILDLLGSISPLMEQRMSDSINENDSSGRDSLYAQAINIFLESPILGKQFVLNTGFYSHNSILDVMIGLGFVGALVWIYLICKVFVYSYRNLLNRNVIMPICLLSVIYMVSHFFSGTIYIDNELSICMLILFLMNNRCGVTQKKMYSNR